VIRLDEWSCRWRSRSSTTGCYCPWPQFAWWAEGLSSVVSAEAEVAVIQENLDEVEVVEAWADAGGAGGGDVMHASWP
jgi:hypothetical protein